MAAEEQSAVRATTGTSSILAMRDALKMAGPLLVALAGGAISLPGFILATLLIVVVGVVVVCCKMIDKDKSITLATDQNKTFLEAISKLPAPVAGAQVTVTCGDRTLVISKVAASVSDQPSRPRGKGRSPAPTPSCDSEVTSTRKGKPAGDTHPSIGSAT
jgi:hypothetical protein